MLTIFQSLDDAFSITHPTFLWIFRMTSNWRSISSLIPDMRDHLTKSGMRTRFGTENSATYINEQGTPIKNYSFIFRELFCTAAADLAADLHEPLEDSGMMFDEIIRTGQPSQAHSKGSRNRASSVVVDIEGGKRSTPFPSSNRPSGACRTTCKSWLPVCSYTKRRPAASGDFPNTSKRLHTLHGDNAQLRS
jgi:hypothetical protein